VVLTLASFEHAQGRSQKKTRTKRVFKGKELLSFDSKVLGSPVTYVKICKTAIAQNRHCTHIVLTISAKLR
jgi:hypothetical protein